MRDLKERFQVERRFRPEIEGLRIVAALLVAVYHIWFNRVSGGVDVFFVISGFLITASIISKIKKDNELSARKYFGGLLKRLLPGALTVIGVTSLLSIFLLPSSILLKYIKEAFASLFYYQNLQLAYSSTDYLDKEQMKTPLEHFWAMSIQGQFYIVWFLIFVFVVYILKKVEWVKPEKLITFIFVVLFILSLAFSIYQTAVNQPFAYFNPLARIWQFALGGLMFLHLNKINVPDCISDILGWLGLIGLVLTGMLFDVGSVFPGIASLWPMLCAILILLSGNRPSKYGVERLLSSRPMVFLGGISFGIYLWHWVILSFYKYKVTDNVGFVEGLAIILLSVGLSVLMTHYIESPLRHKLHFPKKQFKLLAVMNVTLIAILLCNYLYDVYEQRKIDKIIQSGKTEQLFKIYPGALSIGKKYEERTPLQSLSSVKDDLSEAYEDGGMKVSEELIILEYGEIKNPKKTILLAGGSHSSQWLGALQTFADEEDIKIIHICMPALRLSTEKQAPHEMKWLQNFYQYVSDHKEQIDLIFAPANISFKTHQDMPVGFKGAFNILSENDIKIFAVRDNPRLGAENNPVEHFEKDENWEMDVSEIDKYGWKDETLKHVVYYDYNDYITPKNTFKPVRGNIITYYDQGHMTDSYVRTLGPIIKDDVLRELDMK
ncbi:acyltransferase family protein [Macrococcoides canis]|uniref:acyltransferase family protein n=1 Tax=Macrococcoides canis TaxID=1855823 RepID=UPI0013E91FEA|nr:acyltransferase [Macrococcus canis]QIH75572.1 acyltransferase family protein [Macrococcus canis]